MNSTQLMTKPQMAAMLGKLPASCVIDAVEDIEPHVNTQRARFVLLNLEREGIVSWRRESPQSIELTPKGNEFLRELK